MGDRGQRALPESPTMRPERSEQMAKRQRIESASSLFVDESVGSLPQTEREEGIATVGMGEGAHVLEEQRVKSVSTAEGEKGEEPTHGDDTANPTGGVGVDPKHFNKTLVDILSRLAQLHNAVVRSHGDATATAAAGEGGKRSDKGTKAKPSDQDIIKRLPSKKVHYSKTNMPKKEGLRAVVRILTSALLKLGACLLPSADEDLWRIVWEQLAKELVPVEREAKEISDAVFRVLDKEGADNGSVEMRVVRSLLVPMGQEAASQVLADKAPNAINHLKTKGAFKYARQDYASLINGHPLGVRRKRTGRGPTKAVVKKVEDAVEYMLSTKLPENCTILNWGIRKQRTPDGREWELPSMIKAFKTEELYRKYMNGRALQQCISHGAFCYVYRAITKGDLCGRSPSSFEEDQCGRRNFMHMRESIVPSLSMDDEQLAMEVRFALKMSEAYVNVRLQHHVRVEYERIREECIRLIRQWQVDDSALSHVDVCQADLHQLLSRVFAIASQDIAPVPVDASTTESVGQIRRERALLLVSEAKAILASRCINHDILWALHRSGSSDHPSAELWLKPTGTCEACVAYLSPVTYLIEAVREDELRSFVKNCVQKVKNLIADKVRVVAQQARLFRCFESVMQDEERAHVVFDYKQKAIPRWTSSTYYYGGKDIAWEVFVVYYKQPKRHEGDESRRLGAYYINVIQESSREQTAATSAANLEAALMQIQTLLPHVRIITIQSENTPTYQNDLAVYSCAAFNHRRVGPRIEAYVHSETCDENGPLAGYLAMVCEQVAKFEKPKDKDSEDIDSPRGLYEALCKAKLGNTVNLLISYPDQRLKEISESCDPSRREEYPETFCLRTLPRANEVKYKRKGSDSDDSLNVSGNVYTLTVHQHSLVPKVLDVAVDASRLFCSVRNDKCEGAADNSLFGSRVHASVLTDETRKPQKFTRFPFAVNITGSIFADEDDDDLKYEVEEQRRRNISSLANRCPECGQQLSAYREHLFRLHAARCKGRPYSSDAISVAIRKAVHVLKSRSTVKYDPNPAGDIWTWKTFVEGRPILANKLSASHRHQQVRDLYEQPAWALRPNPEYAKYVQELLQMGIVDPDVALSKLVETFGEPIDLLNRQQVSIIQNEIMGIKPTCSKWARAVVSQNVVDVNIELEEDEAIDPHLVAEINSDQSGDEGADADRHEIEVDDEIPSGDLG